MKLNIGCGNNYLIGYINIDKYNKKADLLFDVENGLPFEDNTVDEILCSHVIEHLINPLAFILDCDRVLKKKGKIIVKLPNQNMGAIDHRTTNIGIEYFYFLREKYNITVNKQWKFTKKLMILRNWKSFRDWFYKRIYDEYNYKNGEKMIIHLGLMRAGSTFLQRNVFPLCKEKVISNELFSGNPVYPVRNNIEFRDIVLEGLREYYGDQKIILCVRNRESWVKSLYNQYIKTGFFYSFDDWYNKIFDDRFIDFESYLNNIKSKFSNVFVFNLDDFNLAELCEFIGVDVNKVVNKKINKSVNPVMLQIFRIINFLKEGLLWIFV